MGPPEWPGVHILARCDDAPAQLSSPLLGRLEGVPSGRYVQGTYQDEVGRNPQREAIRETTITRPLWVMRSEVTQQTWKALAPRNPSHFRGDALHVDTVT